MVCRWCIEFTAGRQHVHDEERSGRPSIITNDLVELVPESIMENRHFTITELNSHFQLLVPQKCHGIPVQKILRQMGSKQLTPEHKAKRVESTLTFLQRYHDDGDKFLNRIITDDETWVAHITPETAQQSMH